tara:strand:- start:2046 stop:2285 length:240 start_codon:yes stop_codon:yes gene_type:complete
MELVYFVLVGAIAGFLASKMMKMESNLVMAIVVGIVGGFVGGWGLGQLGLMLPWGMVGEIITAALGAVVLLYLYKLVAK